MNGQSTSTPNRLIELLDGAYSSEDEIWDSDESADELFYNNEYEERDTDDEAEEANAADDIIKIIEGDW